MADYIDLHPVMTNNNEAAPGSDMLRKKIEVACTIAADIIRSGNDDVAPFDQTAGMHDKRIFWADQVFRDPDTMIDATMRAVVAANSSASQSNIINASDAAIQSNVNAVVDVFAVAMGSPPA